MCLASFIGQGWGYIRCTCIWALNKFLYSYECPDVEDRIVLYFLSNDAVSIVRLK